MVSLPNQKGRDPTFAIPIIHRKSQKPHIPIRMSCANRLMRMILFSFVFPCARQVFESLFEDGKSYAEWSI